MGIVLNDGRSFGMVLYIIEIRGSAIESDIDGIYVCSIDNLC